MDYIQVPFPRLPMQEGQVDQRLYFLEPTAPARDQVGQLRSFLPHQVRPGHFPASFGKGFRLYQKEDTEEAPGFRLYFARRLKNQGTTEHGIQRDNADDYELAKFNKLLHPGDDEHNTNIYQKPGDWKELPEDMQNQLKLKTWPLSFEVPTLAPFKKSRFGFTKPMVSHSFALAEVLRTPEIFNMILGYLVGGWEDVSNLGRASQLFFEGIDSAVTHCDLTSASFLDIEKSESELRWLLINGERTRDEVKHVEVSPFLLVSPMRKEFNEGQLSTQGRLNEHGYCDTRDMLFQEPRIEDQMKQCLKLYRAVLHRPDGFRNLLLQRVPFMNIFAVKAILRSLPYLETIGIYNCDLMTFGDTSMLLEAVRDINIDRAEGVHVRGTKNPLDVDFYPRYFQGPILGSLGCFGVIPHDEGTLEIPRAVVAGLLHLVPLAKSAGIDLLSPGKAFRRWLDKLPFPIDTLPYILEAIMNLVDYRDGVHGDANLTAEQKHDMEMTLWVDIMVATNGGPMREEVLNRALLSPLDDRRIVLYKCKDCEEHIPVWFYRAEYADRRPEYRVCHGCQMAAYLAQHSFNMHRRKRDIANRLWEYGNITDVRTLMEGPLRPSDGRTIADTIKDLTAPDSGRLNHRLRLFKAWVRHLQQNYRQDQERIIQLEQQIANLREQTTLPRGNDPALWNLERDIAAAKKELMEARVRTGRGQYEPSHGSGLAVSWQRLIDGFRGRIAIETGQLVNRGPYSLVNMESFARDCTGF